MKGDDGADHSGYTELAGNTGTLVAHGRICGIKDFWVKIQNHIRRTGTKLELSRWFFLSESARFGFWKNSSVAKNIAENKEISA